MILRAVLVSILPLVAQDWTDRKIADWTEDDAKAALTDSPWAKPVEPHYVTVKSAERQRPRFSIGGLGRVEVKRDGRTGTPVDRPPAPPRLIVRWESAPEVQAALVKAGIADAPSIPDGSDVVAVLGLPSRMVGDQKKLRAELKREGKPVVMSTGVRVLQRDDGTMVLFLFPRTDRPATFETIIGPLEIVESFDSVMLDGKKPLGQ